MSQNAVLPTVFLVFWGALVDHFRALWGLTRRPKLGFRAPDLTKSEIQELSVYFLVQLKKKGLICRNIGMLLGFALYRDPLVGDPILLKSECY